MAIILGLSPVAAQELTTGIVEGTVRLQNLEPLPAARVNASGPQGDRVTVTDAEGRYRLPGLAPGIYLVKAEAAACGTVVQTGVRVSINRRTQLDFVLSDLRVEEIRVESEAPLVDLKSTTTGASIRLEEFAPYVPLGRDLISLFSVAPGVTDGGTVGESNPSISGSSGLENAYFVDGVNITNTGFGALGAFSRRYGSLGTGVTYGFVDEVQIKTGGFEADYGQAGGGVINSVVRGGTNKFSLTAGWYPVPGGLEATRTDVVLAPSHATEIEARSSNLALALGGPALRDRLFYFAAYEPIRIEQDFKLVSGDPTFPYYLSDTNGDGVISDGRDVDGDGGPEPQDEPLFFDAGETISGGRVPSETTRVREIDNYAGKLTWFPVPDHKLELTAFGDPSNGEVGPQTPTSFLQVLADPVSNPDPETRSSGIDWGGHHVSLKHQGVWTRDFFTELMYAHKRTEFREYGPGTRFRRVNDAITLTTSGGLGGYGDVEDEVDQWCVKFTHVWGPLELRYGYQQDDMSYRDPGLTSGEPFNAFIPRLVEDVPVDTDGDGIADENGFGLLGDGCFPGEPGCVDPSYAAFESTGGAWVGRGRDGFYSAGARFGPLTGSNDSRERNAFVQLNWDLLPNLNLKAGLRWTDMELAGTGSQDLPWGQLPSEFVTAELSSSIEALSYEFEAELAPRIGLSWDVRNDGRHKLYANYGHYYQRVPSDLSVRAFSAEAGVDTRFLDFELTQPYLDQFCNIDTDRDGIFETVTPCKIGGGSGVDPSWILDGTQRQEGSELNQFLGAAAGLTTEEAIRLPYTTERLAGYSWQIDDRSSIELRYIEREVGRVLEDVQFASVEQFRNEFWGASGFPGSLAFADPFPGFGASEWGAYVLANPGDNVNRVMFPPPVRDYRSLEMVYNRHLHEGWMALVNYRLGKLTGNYEGTYRNDNGQADPYILAIFDFPTSAALDEDGDGVTDQYLPSPTLRGQLLTGPLNTDRRHILNAFLSKQFDFGLNVGGRLTIRSGQPAFPLLAHPAYGNSGEIPGIDPVYWWPILADVDGDGEWDGIGFATDPDPNLAAPPDLDYDGDGDIDTAVAFADSRARLHSYQPVERGYFGRNPSSVTFDLKLSYDVKLSRGSALSFTVNAFNVLNDTGARRFDHNIEISTGQFNPNYLRTTAYQLPRSFLLGVTYSYR